jgi:uncharacterized membrane protein YcaP (DUF421 family)
MKILFLLVDISGSIRQYFGSDTGDLNMLQMMLRASITFLIALVLIRVAGIRSFGRKSAFDIVLSITVGAVLSRCITGKYSFPASLAAAATLALMHRLFATLAYYSKRWNKLIKGVPHLLMQKGQINWKNMKLHNLTRDDIDQAMRKEGLAGLDEAAELYFETDGKISVIPKKNILA